jgi:AraC-like DNA-binding protein
MTADNYSMMGSVAALIAETLRTIYGCDPEPLFNEAELDMALLSNPDTRYPGDYVQQLWQLAVDASGDPCFGFVAGEQVQPVVLHGLGFSWLASDTLRDALTRLVRYSRLISTAANMHLQDTADGLDLVLLPPKGVKLTPAFQDAGMSGFLRMCRLTAGDEIDPAHVSLKRSRPDCARMLEAYFRAPIEYDTANNILSFSKQLIDTPLAHANPSLARINDQAVVDYLARFDRDSITMQVRKKIIEGLHDGTPHQETIAHSLNVSLRSLQRKLNNEDTNFKTLLETTRRELALHYIRETHRSLGEITYLLGFSEPSNFTRAFKRWTGVSPIEYRGNN